jgi:Cysteine-rich CPCC
VSQRFIVGETVVVRRRGDSRGRVRLCEIVKAPSTPGDVWNVRLSDGSTATVADEDLLEHAVLVRHPCECCGHLTLVTFVHAPPGTYEICPVCSWEDDYLKAAGGANGDSIETVRSDFEAWRNAGMPNDPTRRPPRPEEIDQRR